MSINLTQGKKQKHLKCNETIYIDIIQQEFKGLLRFQQEFVMVLVITAQ